MIVQLKTSAMEARANAATIARDKILLIEDEAVIALDMAHDLASWGYGVVGVVHSMEQALRAVELHRPRIALVDVTLHGEDNDGVEIAEVLKEKFGTEIVFLTSHSDQATRNRIIKLDPMGYLFKPYSAYALRQLLETYELD